MSLAPQPVNASFELAGLQVAGTNPSLTGWIVLDGQLVQDTSQAHTSPGVSGRWSAIELDTFAATNPVTPDFALGRLWATFPEGERFQPWATYTLTAWMFATTPVTAALRFGYVPNGVPSDCVTSNATPIPADTWTPVLATWSPGKPYEGPQVQASPFLTIPGAARALWLDDLLVTSAGR